VCERALPGAQGREEEECEAIEGRSMSRKRDPVLCDYCGGHTELVDDAKVYACSYGGKVYLCRPCNAWVGTHQGGATPKGRLANATLRKLKIEAHAAFDPLWRAAMKLRGWKKNEARNRAYDWLSKSMDIPRSECHIGMFNEQRCSEAIQICRARKPVGARGKE
jgi:hypothetical protein